MIEGTQRSNSILDIGSFGHTQERPRRSQLEIEHHDPLEPRADLRGSDVILGSGIWDVGRRP